jgi:hypothetical protein
MSRELANGNRGSHPPVSSVRTPRSKTLLATARLVAELLPQGSSLNHPSTDALQVSTPTDRGPLRHDAATRHARSVFVVSHHPDGFLHLPLHGLVASRSRSWGSPGSRRAASLPRRRSPMPYPSERSPPLSAAPASPQHPAPLSLHDLRQATRNFEAFIRQGVRCRSVPLPARCARGSLGLPTLSPSEPEGSLLIPPLVPRSPTRRGLPGSEDIDANAPEGV